MTILLTVVFLAGNAVFVGAQFALITARRDQIEPLAEQGNLRARAALGQLRTLPRMLAGSQLGIALCSLGLGAVAEPGFAHLVESGFDAASLPESLLHPTSFVVALAFVSFCHMVLGEMVPKNLALAGPVRAALWLGPPMAAWVRATRPLLIAINGLANGLLRLFRVEATSELGGTYSAEDLSRLFAESVGEGLLAPHDEQRLNRALALDRMTARDLLLPLSQLVTLTPHATARELEQLVASTGYSRFPIRDGDQLIGYVHVKDLLELDPARRDDPLPQTMVRPMVSVAGNTSLSETLFAMQNAGSHMARVLEGDATRGVIALEDVLEQLVGEVTPGQ
jgi:CBS domain containing-hemolysin-like protein